MKYLTEYQRNYQGRAPKPLTEQSIEEQNLNRRRKTRGEKAARRSVRPRSAADARRDDENFAVIGPNPSEKFSSGLLYRMKTPVRDQNRPKENQEFALLGRNEKFENNLIYPLRKPIIVDSPRKVVRRKRRENSEAAVQTDQRRVQSASHDAAHRRRPLEPRSEYRTQFDWKPTAEPVAERVDRRPRTSETPTRKKPVEKISVAVNTPARVELEVSKPKTFDKPTVSSSAKQNRLASEYQIRYRAQKPTRVKSFEAENVENRRKKPEQENHLEEQRAQSDDENAARHIDLGREFREKNPHGKLRRWQSEYRSTFKPFYRYDYKDGRWYKDSSAEEQGFNPDSFWYKELISTRKRADEFRAKAETDHFSPQHTMQLQDAYKPTNPLRAWDVDDDDGQTELFVSVDRDRERERQEGKQRREKDAFRITPPKSQPAQRERNGFAQSGEFYSEENFAPRTNEHLTQTEKPAERIIFFEESPTRVPSSATRAFVRNLSSTSVQQNLVWDSESLYTQRTNSDLEYESLRKKNLHQNLYPDQIENSSPRKRETRGTVTDPRIMKNSSTSPRKPSRSSAENGGKAANQEFHETGAFDVRPSKNSSDPRSNQRGRFKDEVTEFYYRDDYRRASRPEALDDRSVPLPYGREENLISDSNRSLASSSSLALRTLERAQQNRQKYWDK